MARLFIFALFSLVSLLTPSQCQTRHGFEPEILHASYQKSSPATIDAEMLGAFVHNGAVRNKRDVKTASSETGSSQASKTSAAPSTSATDSDKSSKKPLNPSQMTVNARGNNTEQTTNNITTMVRSQFLFVCIVYFHLPARKSLYYHTIHKETKIMEINSANHWNSTDQQSIALKWISQNICDAILLMSHLCSVQVNTSRCCSFSFDTHIHSNEVTKLCIRVHFQPLCIEVFGESWNIRFATMSSFNHFYATEFMCLPKNRTQMRNSSDRSLFIENVSILKHRTMIKFNDHNANVVIYLLLFLEAIQSEFCVFLL